MNKIPYDELIRVVEDAGLDVRRKSAWTVCTAACSKGRIIIRNTRLCCNVHLSDIDVEGAVLKISRDEAKARRIGRVSAELDFAQPKDEIIRTLRAACDALNGAVIGTTPIDAEATGVEGSGTRDAPRNIPIDTTGDTLARLNFDPPIMRREPTISKDERKAIIREAAARAAAHEEECHMCMGSGIGQWHCGFQKPCVGCDGTGMMQSKEKETRE